MTNTVGLNGNLTFMRLRLDFGLGRFFIFGRCRICCCNNVTDVVHGVRMVEVIRRGERLAPAHLPQGDATTRLYGYLVVHIVHTSSIRSRGRRPLIRRSWIIISTRLLLLATIIARVRSVIGLGIVGSSHHLHGVGHLQRSNERHRSSSVFTWSDVGCSWRRRGWGWRDHACFSLNLRWLSRVWRRRKHRYPTAQYRMISSPRCRWIRLLRRTCWIRPVVVVGQGWSLCTRSSLLLFWEK